MKGWCDGLVTCPGCVPAYRWDGFQQPHMTLIRNKQHGWMDGWMDFGEHVIPFIPYSPSEQWDVRVCFMVILFKVCDPQVH